VPGVRRNGETSEKQMHPSRNTKLPVLSLQQKSKKGIEVNMLITHFGLVERSKRTYENGGVVVVQSMKEKN